MFRLPLTPQSTDEVLSVAESFSFGTVPHGGMSSMVHHSFEKCFEVGRPLAACWNWLNDPSTFTRGQIWPYRVEFVSPDENVPPGFHVGVLNWHHGPWLDFAGVITEVRPMSYRDLKYFYGSFAISPRLIRPTRLQFWTDATGPDSTRVRLQVDSLIRKSWAGSWTWVQSKFWNRFPKWMHGQIKTE